MGWGPKCNHLVAKHTNKQRTIVCSDKAAFHFNVVVAGLIPCLNCRQHCQFHQLFGGCGGEIVEITRHARVIWLPWLGGLPHFAAFTWRKLTLPQRVTWTGLPGNPPWWGTTPNMWTQTRKKELKTSKSTKKCKASRRRVGLRPDCHTFLCKFWHFQMAVSQWKLAWGLINTKLMNLVNLGKLFLTMWINSC